MIRKNPSGDLPQVHASAFVDPTAIICGKVVVHANVFIWPYAVIRADEVDSEGRMQPIVIATHSNIQDGVVIRSKSGAALGAAAPHRAARRGHRQHDPGAQAEPADVVRRVICRLPPGRAGRQRSARPASPAVVRQMCQACLSAGSALWEWTVQRPTSNHPPPARGSSLTSSTNALSFHRSME
jgi:hypothetical protein